MTDESTHGFPDDESLERELLRAPVPAARCAVCRLPMPEMMNTPGFCPEHLPDRMERERIGVSTQDLSVRWHDTLRDWRERPGELGEDADTKSFRFSGRRHSWVLFRRGYLLR